MDVWPDYERSNGLWTSDRIVNVRPDYERLTGLWMFDRIMNFSALWSFDPLDRIMNVRSTKVSYDFWMILRMDFCLILTAGCNITTTVGFIWLRICGRDSECVAETPNFLPECVQDRGSPRRRATEPKTVQMNQWISPPETYNDWPLLNPKNHINNKVFWTSEI